jgi:glycosyltransferase involved in cell wall biosynthesis
MIVRNQTPKGGTELQFEFLRKHVDPAILNQVQICTSVPEKIPLHPTKVNILWQKNSYDQPNLAPWFQDVSNHNKYDWYVFNSHWTYEKFRTHFKLPTERCVVIKNGIEKIEPIQTTYEKGKAIRIIHQNTPWRGLNVLLGAMQLVKNPWITLDVYSSTEVYGKDFYEQNDRYYQTLYEQADAIPNVNYIGYKPNYYIRENLKNYRMYAYPSTFEETSCISLLECMAAGLYCITTDLGALFETGAEFPIYIPYTNNYKLLATKFAAAIEAAAESLESEAVNEHLKFQIKYTNKYYNWNKQGLAWTRFLQGAINAKQ